MKILALFGFLLLLVPAASHAATEVDYSPGGKEWAKTWAAFYHNPGSEEDLMTPLIKAGRAMIPVILEAISHKDMRQRRYAIGALGNLHDPRAIQALTAILEDKSEKDYFRGDALVSIYKINQKLGSELARKYAGQGDNLKMMSDAIIKKEPWLLVE